MSPYYKRLREKIGKELLLIPSVAAVIHNEAGELLLQEKYREPWSLPAGAIEPGETPEEAICREVLEETGLEVEPVSILGVFGGMSFRYSYPNDDRVEYMVVLYKCRIIQVSNPNLDLETKSIRYVAQHEKPELALPYPHHLLWNMKREERGF